MRRWLWWRQLCVPELFVQERWRVRFSQDRRNMPVHGRVDGQGLRLPLGQRLVRCFPFLSSDSRCCWCSSSSSAPATRRPARVRVWQVAWTASVSAPTAGSACSVMSRARLPPTAPATARAMPMAPAPAARASGARTAAAVRPPASRSQRAARATPPRPTARASARRRGVAWTATATRRTTARLSLARVSVIRRAPVVPAPAPTTGAAETARARSFVLTCAPSPHLSACTHFISIHSAADCGFPSRGACSTLATAASTLKCTCLGSWQGLDCGCQQLGCSGRGVCDPLGTSGKCSCADGFGGFNCKCAQSGCGASDLRGECNPTATDGSCLCDAPWSGSDCGCNMSTDCNVAAGET